MVKISHEGPLCLLDDSKRFKIEWDFKKQAIENQDKDKVGLESNIKYIRNMIKKLTTVANPILKKHYEKINKEKSNKNNVVINLNNNNKNKLREVESK